MASFGILLSPQGELPLERDDVHVGRVGRFGADVLQSWSQRFFDLPGGDAKDRAHGASPFTEHNWGSVPASAYALPAPVLQDIKARAVAWVDAHWPAWQARGRAARPTLDLATIQEVLGLAPRLSLQELRGYRGKDWRDVPAAALKRVGARHGILTNQAELSRYDLGGSSSEERALLTELARVYGGDYLAVWTFGHAVHVLLLRSEAPGRAPHVHGPLSLHVTALAPVRPGAPLETLRRWFAGASLRPDWEKLERELAAPALSVVRLFEAFGLPGAQELAAEDAPQLWQDVEQVGGALLQGAPPEKASLTRLNAVLREREAPLPAKPPKPGKGTTARALNAALHALQEQLGPPTHPPLQARLQAAERYGKLASPPHDRRLTTGVDAKRLGTSASVGRLLAQFPAPLARDPLFLAMLAHECEAWNGHGLAQWLQVQAECAREVGMVAVAVPAARRAALRQAFGIEAPNEGPGDVPAGPWAAELFLTHPLLLKADAAALLRSWLGKSRADGVLAVLPADGAAQLTHFQGGAEAPAAALGLAAPQPAALASAAAALDVRGILPLLGVGDLLAPEVLPPDAAPELPGLGRLQRRHPEQLRRARALLAAPAQVERVADWSALRSLCCGRLHGTSALRLSVPGAGPAALEELRADLGSWGELHPWVEEGAVWAFGHVDVKQLSLLLGDLPEGSGLQLASADPALHLRWELQRG